MESIKIKKVIENSDFCAVIYDVYDEHRIITKTEFVLMLNPMLRKNIDHMFWLKVVNSINSNLIGYPIEGVSGSLTNIEFEFLNKRIVKQGDTLIGAEDIFNDRFPYIYGEIKMSNTTINEKNLFIKFDTQFIFYSNGNNLGKIRYQIFFK